MATVRLYGHAGSDVQGAYLPKALIEADEARDPLLAGAALMAEHGWMTPAEIAVSILGELILCRAELRENGAPEVHGCPM